MLTWIEEIFWIHKVKYYWNLRKKLRLALQKKNMKKRVEERQRGGLDIKSSKGEIKIGDERRR